MHRKGEQEGALNTSPVLPRSSSKDKEELRANSQGITTQVPSQYPTPPTSLGLRNHPWHAHLRTHYPSLSLSIYALIYSSFFVARTGSVIHPYRPVRLSQVDYRHQMHTQTHPSRWHPRRRHISELQENTLSQKDLGRRREGSGEEER